MLNLEYLKNLNEKQKEAVLSLDGPLLIVAGAGSGKTKVLISRIAHIIEKKKAYPNQILAVTFTNKAAKEMQNRISKILKKGAIGIPWLGTFHSVCAKLIRKHAKAVNLNSNFTIVDQDDQSKLIKNISKAENIDTKKISPRYILSIIDQWKNKGWYPEDVVLKKSEVFNVAVGDRTSLNELFKLIQNSLKENGITYKKYPKYRDFREGDVKHSQADISKAKENLGFNPQFSIEKGILKSVKWYLEQ